MEARYYQLDKQKCIISVLYLLTLKSPKTTFRNHNKSILINPFYNIMSYVKGSHRMSNSVSSDPLKVYTICHLQSYWFIKCSDKLMNSESPNNPEGAVRSESLLLF